MKTQTTFRDVDLFASRADTRGQQGPRAPVVRILDVVTERAAGLWQGRASMTIIMVMPDTTLPLSEIKKRLSEIVDGVESTHDRVVLTRNGRPAAVIMSPDDLEALEETVEILSNPVAVRAIRRAEAEIDKGKVLTADELRTKYLKR